MKTRYTWCALAILAGAIVTCSCEKPSAAKPDHVPEEQPEPTPEPPAEEEEETATAWLELPAVTGDEDHVGTFYAGEETGENRNYSYCYDTGLYSSLWTAWPLYKDAMGSEKRPDDWSWNPQLPSDQQIDVCKHSYGVNYEGDINNTIYSRGHQIPNGDRNGSKEMQLQTFYVTNSTPQIQDHFNGGIWQKLEQALQDMAKASESDTLYIATGPVFTTVGGDEEVQWIQPRDDEKQAPVPNYYWKAALKVKRSGDDITEASAIGFWFEHRQYGDSYDKHAVSVDFIEEKTGLDLFAALPDELESGAEAADDWDSFRNF